MSASRAELMSGERIADRVDNSLRNMKTRLLQAFYGYAGTNDRPIIQIEGGDAIVVGRDATLENRVLEIGKRLDVPPTA